MSRKLDKRPKNEEHHIRPHDASSISPDNMSPLFSLSYMARDHCITCCERDERAAFAVKLRELSQLTWAQLRNAPRQGMGYEKINRDSFRVAIPSQITEDVHIIAFRFDGSKPIVGFRDRDDRRIFHIVWVDRNFTVYDHGS